MPIIRVLVVEDYEPMRRTVRVTLQKRPNLQIVGEASDGLEAVQRAVELKPDLILMDIGLPSLNGIEAARQIRELIPETKIVFLSQETSPDVIQEALSVGASGYVTKINAGIELFPAIYAVTLGEHFVSHV
jgi:DNA-binding NarL/FixJ family response regulator